MSIDDSRPPVRRPRRNDPSLTIGRATFNPRTLPNFEEHRIGGFWRPGVHQYDNWRSVQSDKMFGPYECLDCGDRHKLPGPGVALICTKLPDHEARRRAVGRIEKVIARAKGQRPNISSDILSDTAGEIVGGRNVTLGAAAFWPNTSVITYSSPLSPLWRTRRFTMATTYDRRPMQVK